MSKSHRKQPGILILMLKSLLPAMEKSQEKGQKCQYSPWFHFSTWKPCAPPGRAEWGWIGAGIKAAEDTEGAAPDAWGTGKEEINSACYKAAQKNLIHLVWNGKKNQTKNKPLNGQKFNWSLSATLWKLNPVEQVIIGQEKSNLSQKSHF